MHVNLCKNIQVVKIIRVHWLITFFMGISLMITSQDALAQNERYKAIPMASGGFVFILDTKEGHAWTWNNAAQGQVSQNGENPRITYQGNVRMNMKPPKVPVISPEAAPKQQERF